MKIEWRVIDPNLTNKSVYRNQPLGYGIDGEEETFKCHGAEQGRAIRRNEAGRGDLSSVQSQARFCDGPDITTPTSNHDTLRSRGF